MNNNEDDRFVTKIYVDANGGNQWEAGIAYEGMTVVTYNGTKYTSTKPVPSTVGNPASNERYWCIKSEFDSKINQELLDVKMLGWSVPRNCPIQNEVQGNNFILKVGRFDMGNHNYSYNNSKRAFTTNVSDIKPNLSTSNVPKIYSEKYKAISNDGEVVNGSTMTLISTEFYNSIYFFDTYHQNSDKFKQDLKGEYVYYELDEYVTIPIDGNEAIVKLAESGSSGSKWSLLHENTTNSNKIYFEQDFREYNEVLFVSKFYESAYHFYQSASYPTSILYDYIGTDNVVCNCSDSSVTAFKVETPTELTCVAGSWSRVYVR